MAPGHPVPWLLDLSVGLVVFPLHPLKVIFTFGKGSDNGPPSNVVESYQRAPLAKLGPVLHHGMAIAGSAPKPLDGRVVLPRHTKNKLCALHVYIYINMYVSIYMYLGGKG